MSHHATRRQLKRRFLQGAALLATGVLLLAGFLLTGAYLTAVNERLIDQGVKVTGVVTAVGPDGGQGDGSVTVSYDAGPRHLVGTLNVGSRASRFTVGQKVDVYYDRHRPKRMTVAGEDNQPGWSVMVMVVALVVGCLVLMGALIWNGRWIRCRRVLAMNPWREAHATIFVDTNNRVVTDIYAPHFLGVFRSPSISIRLRGMPNRDLWTTGTVWVAGGTGRHAVLAKPGGEPLLPLRSLRRRRGLRSVRTAMREPAWAELPYGRGNEQGPAARL